MTAEDLYAFRFLADAQLSPDGERVAFTVRTVTPERDGYTSRVWLVPFDGSREAVGFTELVPTRVLLPNPLAGNAYACSAWSPEPT